MKQISKIRSGDRRTLLAVFLFILSFSAIGSAQKALPECKLVGAANDDERIKSFRIDEPSDYREFDPLVTGEADGSNPVIVKLAVETGAKCKPDPAKFSMTDIFTNRTVALINPQISGNAPSYTFTAEISRGRENYYFRLRIFYDHIRLDDPALGHVDFIVRKRNPDQGDNGIYVLSPKIYDERSLIEKLSDLEDALAGKLFIDPSKVASAVGALQGGRENDSSFNLQATTLPLPSVTQAGSISSQTNSNLANGSATGSNGTTSNSNSSTTTANSTSSNTNTSMPTVSPSAPALAAQAAGFNPQLAFGQSASNLLAEQMQLSYEAINIRTLLERAMSDNVDLTSGNARDQVVLGFKISIDSRGAYKDAVAEVRIKVKNLVPVTAPYAPGPPNIVSILPQEKTYNVATITKNAKQFGLGAVVSVINFGVSASSSKDTFYLVRDNDTIALEGDPFDGDTAGAISFAWQFRPVLGQKIVQPGTRNVLALLSLPPSELKHDEYTTYVATVEVKTRWRKYDATRGTVGDQIGDEASRYFDAVVIPTYKSDFTLPTVESISWEDARNGQALVVVKGKKFVRGTGVLAGTTTINSPATGLVISDERNLRFTLPMSQLGVLSDIYLSGRYGAPRELLNKTRTEISADDPVKVAPVNGTTSTVTFTVKCKSNCDRSFSKLERPLVVIADQVFGTTGTPLTPKVKLTAAGNEIVSIDYTFQAPTQLLSDAKSMLVKYPFLPTSGFTFQKDINIEDSFSATGVVLLASSDGGAQLAIKGTAFENDPAKLKVQVGDKVFKVMPSAPAVTGDGYLLFLSKQLLDLSLKFSPKELSTVSNIVVTQDDKTILLPIELKPPALPKPEFHAPLPAINQGDSKVVEFKGANFSSLQSMSFEGKPLKFTAKDDGATLEVEITTEVTGLKGVKRLTYTSKDGKTDAVEITVGDAKPPSSSP